MFVCGVGGVVVVVVKQNELLTFFFFLEYIAVCGLFEQKYFFLPKQG